MTATFVDALVIEQGVAFWLPVVFSKQIFK
jgi:hypothetical protein